MITSFKCAIYKFHFGIILILLFHVFLWIITTKHIVQTKILAKAFNIVSNILAPPVKAFILAKTKAGIVTDFHYCNRNFRFYL